MTEQVVILDDKTRFGPETGAGLMRNRCAFTSRDMAADWPEAFTYAIVFGWGGEEPDEDCWAGLAEKYEWDDEMVAFLKDAHARFEKLADKRPGQDMNQATNEGEN